MATTKRATTQSGSPSEYTEKDVSNVQFPEYVRMRPQLHIGPIGQDGVVTIIREVLDNVVDEALAGRGSALYLHIDPSTKTYTVIDNGNGIPVGTIEVKDVMQNVHKVSALHALTGILQSSGKFGSAAYKISRGSHGIGIKASNALSVSFEVTTFSRGQWWNIAYKKGALQGNIRKAKAPINPITKKPCTKGTWVQFIPDKAILGADTPRMADLIHWSAIASYFTPGLGIVVAVETAKGMKAQKFVSPDGPVSFLRKTATKLEAKALIEGPEYDPLQKVLFTASNEFLDCAMAFTSYSGSEVSAYTNGLLNPQGGTHSDSFYRALAAALTPFLKRGQGKLEAKSVREGVIGIINAKLGQPKFSSQDKARLTDDRMKEPAFTFLIEQLTAFFKRNKILAGEIIEQAMASAKLYAAFKLSKEASRNIKKIVKQGFPSKAQIAPNARPEDREIYIVEGDSAGGTAKDACHYEFQEILPIRGKIANAERDIEKATASEEVQFIFAMLGYNPSVPDGKDPLEKLRASKVIFMADPDVDGPLPGDTEVWVKTTDDDTTSPVLMTMRQLASSDWFDREYYVYTHNGRDMTWVPATNCRVREVAQDWERIVLSTGVEQECTQNHQWLALTSGQPEGAAPSLIHTRNLRPGDRICMKPDGLRSHSNQHFAVSTAKAFGGTKLREVVIDRIEDVHSETFEPFFCLTVPTFHTFMLGNEMMSGNCHINSLLLTMMAKYAPSLFQRGMVYIQHVDEYYSYDAKTGLLVTGMTPNEVESRLKETGKRLPVNHIKGYGEVDPSLLRKLAFDKATRKLLRVVPEDPSMKEFRLLMGKDSKGRKEMIGMA